MDWRKMGFFASLASIFGSIGIYFNGDEQLGIFVGLWASAVTTKRLTGSMTPTLPAEHMSKPQRKQSSLRFWHHFTPQLRETLFAGW